MTDSGYERVPFGEVIERFEAGVSVRSNERPARDGEHGVLKVSCVNRSGFQPAENKVVLVDEIGRLGPSPRTGDVILTRANTIGLVALAVTVGGDYPNLHLSDKHWRVVLRYPHEDSLSWVKHVINSGLVRRALIRRATGTSGSMKNVSQDAFLKIQVLRPPSVAQRRIADVLDEHEHALGTLQDLIAAKRRFKRGLMQELLTGKRRFKEFAGEPWQEYLLGDFLTESRIPSSDGRHARRLTVRLYGKGVVATEGRRRGSANTRYYRRTTGQFMYSKLDFLNGACGIVPDELDGFETTLDLPAFDVSPGLDVRWLVALVSQPWFYRRHVGLAIGGRKARRLPPTALLGIRVRVPPVPEQQRITELIDASDQEIRLLERLRDALECQRRGVAELLLTGRICVPG